MLGKEIRQKKSSADITQKIKLDLTGNNWQFDGFPPGEGAKLGFHDLPFDITGDAFNWSYARVPGDVYTDLWRSGRIDDPHYGRNSVKAKWVPEKEWWYKRQFDVPDQMKGKQIQLIFEGVDYGCDVYLNGQLLGSHEGMFSHFEFDVTELIRFEKLRFGTNVLMVRLHPAPRRYSQVAGRKPAWHGDYWVSLPPTGIWRPVYLEAKGQVHLKDTYVKPVVNNDASADLGIKLELDNTADEAREVNISVEIEGSNFESASYQHDCKEKIAAGPAKTSFNVHIDDPKLWWPWDLGDQNLYTAHVTVRDVNGDIQDSSEVSFGIRQLEMAMNPGFTKGEVENPWTVMINGERHFIRSGTWGGPPDIFFGRAHEHKYRELIRLAKEANLNNLRIFGWHPPEIPLFYKLCDEAGITVWQDIVPLASLTLPDDAEFKEAVFKEAINLVKYQRNHPCLIFIEGSEELFMTAADPAFNLKFVNELEKAIRPYTDLHYLPSSPLSDEVGLKLGFKPKESYHANDLFYGEGEFTMEEYFPSLDYAAIPELAISSCPNVESIKKFIPEEELWPPGPSWGHHWTDFDALRTLNFEVLGDESIDSMENFVEATQIAQGVIFQFALEHFRRRKPKTSAICICHYITFAPDMKWGIVDYYQDKKISFEYVRLAYQPLLVSLKYEKRRWLSGDNFTGELWVVNDRLEEFKGCKVQITFLGGNKQKLDTQVIDVSNVNRDSSEKYGELSIMVPGQLGDRFYCELVLQDASGNQLAENNYMFLVADFEEDKKKLRAIGEEAFEVKQQYGWANYYRYFQGLGGEDGMKEADEVMPTVRKIADSQKKSDG